MPEAIRTENRVFSAEGLETIGDLARRFESTRPGLHPAPDDPLGIICASALEACAAAAWLAGREIEALILPEDRLTSVVRDVLLGAGYHLLHPSGTREKPPVRRLPHPGRISVLTSGTTGVPKLVPHNWTTLHTTRGGHRSGGQRWLLTYQAGTYAWFQVLTLVLFRDGHDLVLATRNDPMALIEAAIRHGATAVSGTPTFWRLVLLQSSAESMRQLQLRQITLGGEPVDQIILDRLHALFPMAALTHIYASTEAGACIIVTDGREGFPAHWIDTEQLASAEPSGQHDRSGQPASASGNRLRLRVQAGTLRVQSPHSSLEAQGWLDTQDLIEIRGDRAIVVGRQGSSIVNVGGTKVSLRDVERALLEDPRVAWCRAYGRRAPLVGALVGIDLVPSAGAPPPAELESALVASLQHRLPEPAVPRIWRFLDRIPATDNLKTEPEELA